MAAPTRIDAHVHCRGEEQSYKATPGSVMKLARTQGVGVICDMPNLKRPILSRGRVEERLQAVKKELGSLDGYYLYVGATADPEQLREAVELEATHPKVVGFKMYAGQSVGNLGVIDPSRQLGIYTTLSELGYTGALSVHCEREDRFVPKKFIPREPWTWNLERPPSAEVEAINDQIRFAVQSNFKGRLHIAHISTPEGVELVDRARNRMSISCGATPHHLMLSTQDMKDNDGIMLKVNPPLRPPAMMKGLMQRLLNGKIDLIETDHAPHTHAEKASSPFMSGIPSLNYYQQLLDLLRSRKMKESMIDDLTYGNPKRIFSKITEK